jgi:hypothetical protein
MQKGQKILIAVFSLWKGGASESFIEKRGKGIAVSPKKILKKK